MGQRGDADQSSYARAYPSVPANRPRTADCVHVGGRCAVRVEDAWAAGLGWTNSHYAGPSCTLAQSRGVESRACESEAPLTSDTTDLASRYRASSIAVELLDAADGTRIPPPLHIAASPLLEKPARNS